MSKTIAPNYEQQFLLPPSLEDWVPADHPVRFIREFVDQLDLPKLGFSMPAGTDGRPAYAPSLLLKIWLYGYLVRIRSTRKLEFACGDSMPLLWLTGLIQPDHNTLWRFWHANRKALRQLFKQTVKVAMDCGCVGLALQAVDGTKIEAAARSRGGWSKERMEKILAAVEQSLEHTELEIAQSGSDQSQEYRLPAGLAQRRALRDQIKAGLAQLAADGRQHYHPVEPEARRMKTPEDNRFGYNAQAVADEKEGVIVACEVTREENDCTQLTSMIQAASYNTGVGAQQTLTVADRGYGSGAEIQKAQEKGYQVLAPPQEGKPAHNNPYASKRFRYDPKAKSVTCPEGQVLDYEGQTTQAGLIVNRYRCYCTDCPVRTQCTKDPKGRRVEVWPHTPATQRMRDQLTDPILYKRWSRRQEIIERIFAQLKAHEGFRRWTVWGLESVRAQWALLCTTLNLRVLFKYWRKGRGAQKGAVAVVGAAQWGPNCQFWLKRRPRTAFSEAFSYWAALWLVMQIRSVGYYQIGRA